MPSELNLGKHACSCLVYLLVNGCDKTPYHYGKGKFPLLNNLMSGTYPRLANVLDEGSFKYAKHIGGSKTFLHCSFFFLLIIK